MVRQKQFGVKIIIKLSGHGIIKSQIYNLGSILKKEKKRELNTVLNPNFAQVGGGIISSRFHSKGQIENLWSMLKRIKIDDNEFLRTSNLIFCPTNEKF